MQPALAMPGHAGNAAIRGIWTKLEDHLLAQAVALIGPRRWSDVAKLVPSRTAKQCRERWYNRLNPTLKRSPFEAWEDRLITEKQRELGTRWALIAQSLPGRSAGAVKNRWYAGIKAFQEPAHAGMNEGDPTGFPN
jgi:hypothetical protein